MKYLLLVSHASYAKGMQESLSMLMGPREYLIACGMGEGVSPEEFRGQVTDALAELSSEDEIVLLADIGGGSPVRNAILSIANAGLLAQTRSFGGMNLPMAISALMAIDDELDLDSIAESVLAEGAAAVRALD
ncbi:MAG: PTS sugar transporter subunit IIA [Coriobacteriales bacterium]|nr:PTS sugar transporter subunit IIA [Coriobacteriales bacterium]